jgi:hypothetical protein
MISVVDVRKIYIRGLERGGWKRRGERKICM